MSMLDQLLAQTATAQAGGFGTSNYLPAGKHKVSLRNMHFREGFNGLAFIVEMDVIESTTAEPGLYKVVRLQKAADTQGIFSDAQKWMKAVIVEIMRNAGEPDYVMSAEDAKPENLTKTSQDASIIGFSSKKETIPSKVEGVVLVVDSVAGESKKGQPLVFHNPAPSTPRAEAASE